MSVNVDINALKLETIYRRTKDVIFSKSISAKIVGGRVRLEKLVGEGKIRADKPTNSQNGKWFCNASDVLRYAKT